jgi:hypothetical protein
MTPVASMKLERQLKTALDETRLLILGAQVLFGFAFQGAFQELFGELPTGSRLTHCAGLLLFLAAVSLLIAPSLHHQILYRGETRRGAVEAATLFAGWSLLPLTLGLGAFAFVVFGHVFGVRTGIIAGAAFTSCSLCLLYFLGFAMRILDGRTRPMPEEDRETPLKTKIEQLLTEARVIIPGGQALLGFQFTATLTRAFSELPASAKYIHAGGLCAIALAVILLMTPAALHRIAYRGEDNETFFRSGSALVIAAAFPLAVGVSANVYVAFLKATDSGPAAAAASLVSFAVLLALWFAYPLARRYGQARGPEHGGR